ncbi:MAG: xylulokinase [Thermotogota bacterium]|nr:xylulokinase [Thermotogota bacterium]
MHSYLSIDLGTMGIKTCLINEQGTLITCQSYEYAIQSKNQGEAVQDANGWWKGLQKGLLAIKENFTKEFEQIAAISICGQMHTHVYLDEHNNILCDAITWLDQRTDKIIEEWKDNKVYKQLFEMTANFPTTSYTAPNIIRIQRENPDMFKKVKKILLAKDYIKFKLTDQMMTDPSDASGTLLYDVEKLKWSDEAFQLLGIKKELFPEVAPSTHIMGRVTKQASAETGLKQDTPVVNGGSDHSVAEIGSGLFESGSVSVIVGTAGVVASCSDKPKKDHKRRIICWAYPLEGKWDLLGLTQTAASSLTWFRNTFDSGSDGEIFKDYSKIASEVESGSQGLIFLPYLLGERTPYWDSKARGVYFGLSMNHKKAHMIRSIMEGVVFSLKNCMDVFEELGIAITSIKTLGGGSKSPVWRQIEASAFNKPIYTIEAEEPSAIGNFILASLGTGMIKTVEEAKKYIRITEREQPIKEENDVYNRQYEKYLKLYDNIKELY